MGSFQTLKLLGRFEEAEMAHRKALRILEEHLGDDHPETATTVGGRAALFPCVFLVVCM